MLLDEVYASVEYVKTIWVRRGGKLEAITRPALHAAEPNHVQEKPMFPISKERK